VATISSDVLARYAAEATQEVPGVRGLVESTLHRRRGVRVLETEDGGVRIELHISVDWGVSIPDLGSELQQRVAAYLARMASVEAAAVDVVVEEIGPGP
jgi:uncharacterized alkaline shock family protein YloU